MKRSLVEILRKEEISSLEPYKILSKDKVNKKRKKLFISFIRTCN